MNLYWKEEKENFLTTYVLVLEDNVTMMMFFKNLMNCKVEQYHSLDNQYKRKYRLTINDENHGVLFGNCFEDVKEQFTESVKAVIETRAAFFQALKLLIK